MVFNRYGTRPGKCQQIYFIHQDNIIILVRSGFKRIGIPLKFYLHRSAGCDDWDRWHGASNHIYHSASFHLDLGILPDHPVHKAEAVPQPWIRGGQDIILIRFCIDCHGKPRHFISPFIVSFHCGPAGIVILRIIIKNDFYTLSMKFI